MVMVTVDEYYHRLESRIGYRLILGGTRHFGYYKPGTWWPFPINQALRAMEKQLYETLGLQKNALLLDAGAGVGNVAIYMAKKQLRVKAIDLLDMHLQWARENVKSRGEGDSVEILKMNFEHLTFKDQEFDGAYTMETLVHSRDPDKAMREFYRVLKSGGTLVHIEYEHDAADDRSAFRKLDRVNKYSHMPAFQQFTFGTIQEKLENVGFQEVEVKDLSQNVLPMLRLFFLLAFIPYLFIRLLGLERTFPNTMAAVDYYRIRNRLRFVSVKARKPFQAGGRGQSQIDIPGPTTTRSRRRAEEAAGVAKT